MHKEFLHFNINDLSIVLTLLKYPTVWQPSESANVII